MTRSVSELINHGGVCRTAPATPGLLNTTVPDEGAMGATKAIVEGFRIICHIPNKNYSTTCAALCNCTSPFDFDDPGLLASVLQMRFGFCFYYSKLFHHRLGKVKIQNGHF